MDKLTLLPSKEDRPFFQSSWFVRANSFNGGNLIELDTWENLDSPPQEIQTKLKFIVVIIGFFVAILLIFLGLFSAPTLKQVEPSSLKRYDVKDFAELF